jgi:L-alanine-DL-glutamate epimerase-like enolase superfamily enzyme
MTRTAGEEQVPGAVQPAPREAIADLRIRSVEAFPVSFRVPQDRVVRHGIGAAVKRDTVLVKVTTECGVAGWGEAHHGRGPTSIADLVNNTLSHFLSGRARRRRWTPGAPSTRATSPATARARAR